MAFYCRHLVTVLGSIGLILSVVFNSLSSAVDTIPIGVLVGHNDHEIAAAFHQALQNVHNQQKQNRIKVIDETVMLSMDNSFSVGTAICQVMSKGIFAFYAAHTPSTLNTIKSYSATFKMPFITSGMAVNTTRQEIGYELYVRPLYVRALLDVISHHGWKEIWYIYNSNEGLERLQQLFDVLTEENYIVRTHVYRVSGGNDAFDTLKHIDSQRSDYKHIVLDLPTKECEALFKQEIKPPRSTLHHFLLVGLGINEFVDGSLAGMNVTGLRFADMPNNQRILKNLKNSDSGHQTHSYEAVLAAESASVMFNALLTLHKQNPNIFKSTSRDNGLQYNNNNATEGIDCDAESPQQLRYGYEIMKALRDTEIQHGLTGVVKFDKYGLRRDYKLEVWESSRNHKLDRIGNWNPSTVGDKKLTVSAPIRMKWNNTISNRTRYITSILDAPFLMMAKVDEDNPPTSENARYEGYCVDLAEEVASLIQIDYRIRPVKDAAYGKKNDDGTWNGMIGELMREEADLAIAPLTITSTREQVIDFSKPFMSLGISIMIKKPQKEAPGVFSFMNPLSYEVWMCVIFAYIGVSVVLFLVSRFSPFEWHIEDSSDGVAVANNFTIFNSLWFSLGAFMQQGVDIEPRSMSGRIVGSVWWFFTLILISSYTANLAAFLTAERMQSPIESAEDLAKQTEIKYGTIDTGSTKEFFRSSSIATYERMWSFMSSTEPSVFVSSTAEGVKRVRDKNGKYAFLMESTVNDYTNNRLPCDTMKVGSNLDSKGYGIGTPPGSDLRDRVTLAVLELIEAGKLETLRKKWWFEKGECSSKEGPAKKQEATSALDLTNVLGIFYILIGGLCMSLLIAGIEFLHKSRLEARRRKTSFTNAARKEARLSITGQRELDDTQSETAHGSEIPPNMSMSTYSYAPAAQLVGLDGFGDANLQTQV